ncbi:MAG: carbon starvation protein A [Phycisphaerales bacterium]
MDSIWLIIGSLAAFAIAYRLYGAFLAAKVAALDDARATPANRLNDGVDYHPTNQWVLFGHHFAAIAGPGPLIGPVMAAQWGYLPGFVWILIGACLAGAVHDFVILWASVREDGLSLPQIARRTMGPTAGLITSIATLFIIVCSLASVASVVVHALADSAWGMFTIILTIPAALITGLWMYRIRPGKVVEASAIGVVIVLLGVVLGRPFAESSWGHTLVFSEKTLSLMLPAYALIAGILPVWVLMCPRDYLSSYMKIGVMAVLGAGLIIANPELKMPATTPFGNGGGPVVAGTVWPYVCITIMCGAISGFHALIASGTTPKMISKERHIRPVGYGAMVVEGFVAVTALVAACALHPGDYFAINAPANETTRAIIAAQQEAGWDLAPKELRELEAEVGERLENRPGGAVTLAVGMAKVFASLPGLHGLMSYWYHFVIMFEALFILTLLETGTRVARFVVQEMGEKESRDQGTEAQRREVADAGAAVKRSVSWPVNVALSFLVCGAWGYLLYRGDLKTLWLMLGIANQLLACIALAVGTTYLLLRAQKRRYALCTAIPMVFVLFTTLWASIGSIGRWWDRIDAPATTPAEAFYLRLIVVLGCVMLGLTVIIAGLAVRRWVQILRGR